MHLGDGTEVRFCGADCVATLPSRAELAYSGIATGVHYPVPLHLQPAFRQSGSRRGDFPAAERACREVLSLPLWPHLPDEAVARVSECIRATARKRN